MSLGDTLRVFLLSEFLFDLLPGHNQIHACNGVDLGHANYPRWPSTDGKCVGAERQRTSQWRGEIYKRPTDTHYTYELYDWREQLNTKSETGG